MTAQRRNYSEAEHLALTTQVDGLCPLCGTGLFYKKKSRSYKDYELAHIYPLNPSAQEAALLAGERMLCQNVNDLDNMIPLCSRCHTRFDKPRTVEEYRCLVEIKEALLLKSSQAAIRGAYQIEKEMREVIDSLGNYAVASSSTSLELEPKIFQRS
ncbi:HNH endonuclease signature motif containing protein [Lysobacter enzymogenes]|uniref:HNH endonuclease signature motif containing protein n=1 Tax=Lysobacter enzymogenes TaxID=69 RepID=UPI003D2F94F6